MTEFHLTRMGHTYYERTLPDLVRQLERLNENLERMAGLRVGQEPQPKEKDHDEDLHPENP